MFASWIWKPLSTAAFSIGIRNANDKSMRLALHGRIPGLPFATTWHSKANSLPVLRRHSRTSIPDSLSIGLTGSSGRLIHSSNRDLAFPPDHR